MAKNATSRSLYEILVPCIRNGKPVRKKHHQEWDKFVRKISGGLSIFIPLKGQWIHSDKNELICERMIPVRFMATEKEMNRIAMFTAGHYCQHTVLVYKISDEVHFKRFK